MSAKQKSAKRVSYRQSIVTYLDILGFKGLIAEKTAGEISQILRIVKETVGPDKKLRETFAYRTQYFSDLAVRVLVPSKSQGDIFWELLSLVHIHDVAEQDLTEVLLGASDRQLSGDILQPVPIHTHVQVPGHITTPSFLQIGPKVIPPLIQIPFSASDLRITNVAKICWLPKNDTEVLGCERVSCPRPATKPIGTPPTATRKFAVHFSSIDSTCGATEWPLTAKAKESSMISAKTVFFTAESYYDSQLA